MINFSNQDILKRHYPMVVCPIAIDGVYGNPITDKCLISDEVLASRYYQLLDLQAFAGTPTYKIIYGKKQMYCFVPVKQCADDKEYDFDLIVFNLKHYNEYCKRNEINNIRNVDIAIQQFTNGEEWLNIQSVIEQYMDELKHNCYIHLYKNKGRQYELDRRKRKPTKKEWNILRNM